NEELAFDHGMEAMAMALGEAYEAFFRDKGSGLSEKDVREVTVRVCRTHLDGVAGGTVAKRSAAGVLASIEEIEVMGKLDSGLSWARAFKVVDRAEGRRLLTQFGATQ